MTGDSGVSGDAGLTAGSGVAGDAGGRVEHVDTVIVGSGFAGLGMGIRLAREGAGSFVILERADDVGGTWRDNDYPGVACDIPSHLYSFSFRPRADWSRLYAGGGEILDYLREAARDEGLLPHLRLGSEVLAASWSDDDSAWLIRTTCASYRCRSLIVATGRLSEKRLPEVPGIETFPGPVFHSSEWPLDLTLSGRRVGVVGTGASAVQILPEVARVSSAAVVFQRSAPYVVPREDRAYSAGERGALASDPEALRALRTTLFWEAERGFAARLGATESIEALRSRALGHLEAQVADPALRRALTPDYEIGCKRILLSDDYYPALGRDNVTLETLAVATIEGSTVTASSGVAHNLDVLVFATGFLSTRPPIAGRIVGRDGLLLDDVWSDGMVAHNSTTVAGFPNLFVIDGPNASLGHNSAVHMIETQIGFVASAVAHLRASGAASLEPRQDAQDAYVSELDRRAESTVWLTGGCRSWYVDDRSRRLTLLWPDTASAFRDEVGRFDPEPYLMR